MVNLVLPGGKLPGSQTLPAQVMWFPIVHINSSHPKKRVKNRSQGTTHTNTDTSEHSCQCGQQKSGISKRNSGRRWGKVATEAAGWGWSSGDAVKHGADLAVQRAAGNLPRRQKSGVADQNEMDG